MITGVGIAHHLGASRVRTLSCTSPLLILTAALAQAAPTATTGAAESVTTGSAAVTGTVNPGGDATTYQFEYGTSTSYGLTTPAADAGSGTTDVAARATLSSLTTNTTYHYRLVATNAAGVARGRRQELQDRRARLGAVDLLARGDRRELARRDPARGREPALAGDDRALRVRHLHVLRHLDARAGDRRRRSRPSP